MVQEIRRHRYTSPPDGGWGWVIVLGSFVGMFIIFGFPRNLGLFINPMRHDFETTTGPIGVIASMPVSLLFATGPVSGILCKRFGSRSTCILGGTLVFIGLGIAFSSTTLFYLAIGLGVLPGLGLGLTFTAIVSIVSKYFDNSFAVANGITFLGGPVSFIICPVIGEGLIAAVGWRRTLLIGCAFALHLVVCGTLMRPVYLLQDVNDTSNDINEYELMTDEQSNHEHASTSASLSSLSSSTCTSNHSTNENYIYTKLKDTATYLELRLFRDNVTFVIIMIVVFLNGFAYEAWLIYLINQAEEMHVSRRMSAIIFTITGCGSLLGRILLIGIAHLNVLRTFNIWIFANILAALALWVDPIFYNVISLALSSVVYGIATGIKMPLTPVLVREYVGIDVMPVAFGWTNFARGIGALIGGVSVGYLRSYFGDYRVAFFFVAVVQSLAVVAVLSKPCSESKQV